jgi:NADH-quinone oxidoreductase subunit J
MNINAILFFVFAIGAIATAITTITRASAVPAATFLIAHFFCLAGLYLTLQAQLLALLQILVYAGAIMVLVVFVIMLLNLGKEEAAERFSVKKLLAVVFAGVLGVQLLAVFLARPTPYTSISPFAEAMGTVQAVGNNLFRDYIFPFEAVSLLLLAAIVGSVMLAKRNLGDKQ